jgi:6-phosphogluconolactonase (cycloisomerase 2 family)
MRFNHNSLQRMTPRPTLSRRAFVKATTGLAIGFSASAFPLCFASNAEPERILAYVGTDTKPVDGPANGKGIYLFEFRPDTGELLLLKLAAETASPSWISLHPSGRCLYAVNEVSDYGGNSGSVSAFSIDRANGDLRLLNTVSSHGAGPTHMSVDASGKYAFVANYFGGSFAVLPILPNGALGEASYVHTDQGSLGSLHAADAPRGSFAISGHDSPHAHMIQPDPTNHFVVQTDLGQDRIYVYRFDSRTGRLTPAETPYISVPSGDGPRHFVFHPGGRWMYSIQEEASTIICFAFDPGAGSLTPQQTVSALPQGFGGSSFGSEILVSPDGRFLYAANRLHNSIAIFAIGGDGKLDRIGEISTQGDYPNQFSMDPSGSFLFVCNQRSDQITSFRIDKNSGQLAFTGRYQPLGTPMCITFLPAVTRDGTSSAT